MLNEDKLIAVEDLQLIKQQIQAMYIDHYPQKLYTNL